MAKSDASEPQRKTAQRSPEPAIAAEMQAPPSASVAESATAEPLTEEAQKISAAVQLLEGQLEDIKAKENELQQQLALGDSESNEAGDVNRNLSELRAAKTQVESALSAVKSGKKTVSLVTLSQLSISVSRILSEAEEEISESGAATNSAQSHKAYRSAANAKTAQKKPIVVKLKQAVLGKTATEKAAEARQRHEIARAIDGNDDTDGAFSLFSPPLPHYVGVGDNKINPNKYRPADSIESRVDAFTGIHIARAAGAMGVLGMDQKAVNTGNALYEKIQHGTGKERDASFNEFTDAVDRHVLGRTFLGQEIDDALATLRGNSAIVSKHGNFGYYLTTDNVREALEKNGALTSGYSIFNSYEANRAWSARNVRRIDENADGQLSAIEITHALQNASATMARAKVAYQAKESPKTIPPMNPNRGRMVRLDGFGDIKIEIARNKLEENGVKIDTNGDGVTYTECLAAITHWNKTHDDNWRPQTTAPKRPAATPRQPK